MIAAMLSRGLHIFLLAFVSLWFGVIAPGHTRGVIKLDGTTAASQGTTSASCCTMPSHGQGRDDASQTPENQPSDPASCCAICYLNATLQTPPPIVLVRIQVDVIDELAPLPPASFQSQSRHSPILGRAPPLAA